MLIQGKAAIVELLALFSARQYAELGAGQGKEIPELEVVEVVGVGVRGVAPPSAE